METLQQIANAALPMVLAIVAGCSPFVVKWVVNYVERRLDFDIAKDDELRLEKAVIDGVHFAEEEYKKRSEKGKIKEQAAVKHILDTIKDSGLPEKAEEWVVAKVKAKLGEMRANGGAK
jgi:hypothetical protein